MTMGNTRKRMSVAQKGPSPCLTLKHVPVLKRLKSVSTAVERRQGPWEHPEHIVT